MQVNDMRGVLPEKQSRNAGSIPANQAFYGKLEQGGERKLFIIANGPGREGLGARKQGKPTGYYLMDTWYHTLVPMTYLHDDSFEMGPVVYEYEPVNHELVVTPFTGKGE